MKVWDIKVWLGHIKKLSMIFKLMVKRKKNCQLWLPEIYCDNVTDITEWHIGMFYNLQYGPIIK